MWFYHPLEDWILLLHGNTKTFKYGQHSHFLHNSVEYISDFKSYLMCMSSNWHLKKKNSAQAFFFFKLTSLFLAFAMTLKQLVSNYHILLFLFMRIKWMYVHHKAVRLKIPCPLCEYVFDCVCMLKQCAMPLQATDRQIKR